MLQKKRPRSSSLFLMELILAILFFSIASAVCVQFFVRSHLLSTESRTLSQAVNECTSAAERLRVSITEECTAGTTYTYYNKDFSICEEMDASYVMIIDKTQDNNLVNVEISMVTITENKLSKDALNTNETIYSLHTSYHIARRTGYEKK